MILEYQATSFTLTVREVQEMPRRAPRYSPTALRVWRTLKRLGIVSPQGIFLSFVFWSLFISFTYYTYVEVSKILAKLEVRKLNASTLHSSPITESYVLTSIAGPSQTLKWDDVGFFKTYWNNNSYVGNFLNYLKDKTLNMIGYK